MPATSASQQRLFGMVRAFQKGKLKNPPKKIRDVATHISKTDAGHFAKTKHEGLSERKEGGLEFPDPNQVRSAALYPFNETNPLLGVGAGAGFGAVAGAGLYGLKKVKRWITGDNSEDEGPGLAQTMVAGAAGGAGVAGLAAIAGQNPYTTSRLKFGSFNDQHIRDMILADTSLPSWKQMQLLQQLQSADSSNIPLEPAYLAGVGLSALAGWLVGRAAGFGGLGSSIFAAGGAMVGNALFKPNAGTIVGQGYYRP